MSIQNKNYLLEPDLLRGTADFDMAHAAEAAKIVGDMLVSECRSAGIDGRVIEVFEQYVVGPVDVDSTDGVSHYELGVPLRRSTKEVPISSRLWIGREGMSNWTTVVAGAFEAAELDQGYAGQAYDIAYAWTIAHELGHGLSDAWAFLHRRSSPNSEWWVYPQLSGTVLAADPTERWATHESDALTIENERQAEGVAMLILPKLLTQISLGSDDAERLTIEIHSALHPRAELVRSSLARTDQQTSMLAVNKDIEGAPKNVNVVGYANPVSAEQLRTRFALEPIPA